MEPSHTPDPSNLRQAVIRLRAILDRLAALWSTPRVGRVAICSPVVGVIAGLGAVGFLLLMQFMYSHVLGGLLHFQMPPTSEDAPHAITYPSPWWLVVLVPAVGGLISGILVFTWAPEAEGHGTDGMIRAFHRGGGIIRTRVPLIKAVASIITIGTGGSAGQEGPIAQIGARVWIVACPLTEAAADRPTAVDVSGSGRRCRCHLPGSAGWCGFCWGSALLVDSLQIGGSPALPGKLDRCLFHVCRFHHTPADFQSARHEFPRPS